MRLCINYDTIIVSAYYYLKREVKKIYGIIIWKEEEARA